MNIIGLTKEQILGLNPCDIRISLQPEDILYIAEILGAHLKVNPQAKYHPKLKSGMHAGEFWNSGAFLQYKNIRTIIAYQVACKFNREWGRAMGPDSIAGIPRGATKLGKDMAKILEIRHVSMIKEDGHIKMESSINTTEIIVLVDDICTEGTAFKETVKEIKSENPTSVILPYAIYVLNLGCLEYIQVELNGEIREFQIIALANYPVTHWKPEDCPFCKAGSLAVKPNETEEIWQEFIAQCS